MELGLFIPCFIDQYFPEVAINSLQLLERLGHKVTYERDQLCCGQALANAGFERKTHSNQKSLAKLYAGNFPIVSPSGSCVAHIKHHYPADEFEDFSSRFYTLTEFLDREDLPPMRLSREVKAVLQQGCHSVRMLQLARSSERRGRYFSKWENVLGGIEGLELLYTQRKDECCGFGGSFSVSSPDLSAEIGKAMLSEMEATGATTVISEDMSCLMHLQGLAQRQGSELRFSHVAELINEALA